MFFIGLESRQYNEHSIMWSRASKAEYRSLADSFNHCNHSLRAKFAEGLSIVIFTMAALFMVSALISIALAFTKTGTNESTNVTVRLLLVTVVLYLVYCIPAFRGANKRRKRSKRLLSAVTLNVPGDVLRAARIRCEAYDANLLLDMLEESGLDVDDYRERDSSEKTTSDIFWLTLNWLQAYPQKLDHLLIELKEEVYSAYFLYAEIDKKDRASVVSESISQIAQLHDKAMNRIRPNGR